MALCCMTVKIGMRSSTHRMALFLKPLMVQFS